MDLPSTRQLDAALGLSAEPRVPVGRRTGLFILALRSVEFTANPIAAYPRTLTGQRSFEDGDIIEATAVTLIPFPERHGAANLGEARRYAAHDIFQSTGGGGGIPQDALPLAMLALENGVVRWVDADMVRRRTAGSAVVDAGFAARPRALAEAHIAQHRAHLADLLGTMQAVGQAPTFPAGRYFGLLPPAGEMPAGAVQPDALGFRQGYFPPTLDVDIAFVPSDEIGAIVEESLALPPIDLDAGARALEGLGVVILVPVNRARYQRFAASLPATSTPVAADPGGAGARPALDLLGRIADRRLKAAEAAVRDADAQRQADADALRVNAWHAAFQEAVAALPRQDGLPPRIWFSRRRAIAYRNQDLGAAVALAGDDIVAGNRVAANLDRLGLTARVAKVNGTATPQAAARAMTLLASAAVVQSDILTVSVVTDLEAAAAPDRRAVVDFTRLRDFVAIRPGSEAPPSPFNLAVLRGGLTRLALAQAQGETTAARKDTPLTLSTAEVLDIAQDYGGPQVGEGLARLRDALGKDWPDVNTALWLGGNGRALGLDAALRAIPGEQAGGFATLVRDAAASKDPAALDAVIAKMR